jgi:glycosyltransferase involved in cell wall biosynthesis
MHILFISDNFPPEVNAPASRTFEHCREWVRAGHSVTVLTCAPNFPTGKLFKGYRNAFYQSEMMDGVRVVRVWSYMAPNEGFLRRMFDYLSFMVSALAASPAIRSVDLVVATSPQFFSGVAGYIAAVSKRRPFVFEVRDLWPESIRAVGAMTNEFIFRALERVELFLYRHAAAVVTVTQSSRTNLLERGIPPAKVSVVTNGADVERYHPRPKDTELQAHFGLEGRFVVGYVGTHGMAHALGTLLDAADRLSTRPEIMFVFLGDGAEKRSLRDRAEALDLRNVQFLDSVPKEEVVRYLSLLDVAVIHLRRTPLFRTVIPSKLFECMAMGIPVLHGVEGESAEIVEREAVGLTFEPENAIQLVEKVLLLAADAELRQRLARRGPTAVRAYERANLAGRMRSLLEAVVEER